MLLKNFVAELEAKAGIAKAFQAILAASILTNVFMAGAFATMDRTVRTVLVPPEINKSFWVDGHNIGPEYLEQMGQWVIGQFASYTPATVEYQSNNLLKYVHPSVHGDLAIRFKMGANRIKAENMSKIFFPREIRVSQNARAVVLIGVSQTWIADKRVQGDEMKAYIAMFDYDGSRVTIKELRETSPTKPFDAPNIPASAEAEAVTSSPSPQQPAEGQQPAATAAPEQQQAVPAQPLAAPSAALPLQPPAPNIAAQEALQSGGVPAQATTR